MKKGIRSILFASLLAGLLAGVSGRDFDPAVYVFKESNALRGAKDYDRLKIYRDVITRYLRELQLAVKMLNYTGAMQVVTKLETVCQDVATDVHACTLVEKNRKRKALREFEIVLRRQVFELQGVRRALPLVYQEKMHLVINTLVETRKELFLFIHEYSEDSE